MSTPRRYYKVRVCIRPAAPAVLPVFTGKVVKSLLIEANPNMRNVFESAFNPKPVSISTLYRFRGGKREYLWKRAGSSKYPVVEPGEKLYFHIGFTEDVEPMVLEAVYGLNGVETAGIKWFLEEVELHSYELPAPSDKIPEEYRISGKHGVKIEFRTPVLLIDPYKKSRYKRFLPTPGNVFAYNIGDLLRLERGRDYINTVILVETVLNETYKVLETAKPVRYVYEGKELPGITGYVNYVFDWDFIKEKEIETFLENLLLHASIMGIGSSRASGFGHVTIKLLEKPSEETSKKES